VLPIAGCKSQKSGKRTLLERFSHARNPGVYVAKPGELAEKGRAEIVEECAKQSYETASKGLIISEIGLHEDVFMLRDRVSYGAMGYSLDEALRLEEMLHAEANGQQHPADQTECIRRFAEHMESLSDPLIEDDQRLKELDSSAFKDASKEAQEERMREAEKALDPKRKPQD
jgi:hypothetical protein